MTKEELLKKIEDDIETQCEWSNIEDRDEAIENVKICYIAEYVRSELEENDFLALMKELRYEIKDMTELRKERELNAKQKAYRKELKERKRANKMAKEGK